LKAGYAEFPKWFAGKANEPLYVVTDGSSISGMIYLKQERGPVKDVTPALPNRHWLKVGTLKIVGQGTRMGERVIKKIFDTALSVGADSIYVTVFDVHASLIALFERYGFTQQATKTSPNGIERVLVRSLTEHTGDRLKDYPFLHTAGRRAWLLAVYPEYHTRLLPDSILNNEPLEIVQDVSHTNTIHKVYIAKLALTRMSPGDIVVFYRTTDRQGHAHYRSVVTSVCVVEEVRSKRSFSSVEDYLAYTRPRSVFTEDELRGQFAAWERLYVAKMTYNAAFGKRTTRGQLIDSGIMSVQPRWNLRELDAAQLGAILGMGEINARLVVD
jgi:L-amino acid N-acyltransferase YncA